MAVEQITFFPSKTNPECAEFAKGIRLNTAGGRKTAAFPKGSLVSAYDNTIKAQGWFRYVFAKVRQVAYKPVYWSSSGNIAGVKSVAASRTRAGVTCALISNSSYGFVQVKGHNFFQVATDKAIAAGDICIKDDNTSDLYLDTATNTGTQSAWVLGRALADDSGSWMAVGKLMIGCE